jgi:hypothetical protein
MRLTNRQEKATLANERFFFSIKIPGGGLITFEKSKIENRELISSNVIIVMLL